MCAGEFHYGCTFTVKRFLLLWSNTWVNAFLSHKAGRALSQYCITGTIRGYFKGNLFYLEHDMNHIKIRMTLWVSFIVFCLASLRLFGTITYLLGHSHTYASRWCVLVCRLFEGSTTHVFVIVITDLRKHRFYKKTTTLKKQSVHLSTCAWKAESKSVCPRV